MRRPLLPIVAAAAACGSDSAARGGTPPPDVDVPVTLNADSPFGYPPTLYDQGVEGDVVLHLYVDETGRLVPESTRVAEPSGNRALDSAALAGAAGLRFAPAIRRGVPVGAAFLQPVQYRRPGAAPRPPTAARRDTTARAAPAPAARRVQPPTPRQQRDSTPQPPRDTTPARPDTAPADTLKPKVDTLRVDTSAVAR